ncbi:hypothetical protein VTJ49DRAFT_7492 [Mycothermus thermophilus]|uniref:Vacuolar ATPase assembly protein VMA22 n=1 Tax=Humicola insolens TaxID=85995 RepID=A0ABR3VQ64_HUMIN
MSNPSEPTPSETIDALLEHYLALLDEYTSLRGQLNTLQASMYQSIARANFAAERGVRYYGQDYYDERMQASRRVCISVGSDGGETRREVGGDPASKTGTVETSPAFSVRMYCDETAQKKDNGPGALEVREEVTLDTPEGRNGIIDGTNPTDTTNNSDDSSREKPLEEQHQRKEQGHQTEDPNLQEKQQEETTPKPPNNPTQKKPNNKNDPLRWFGILTPLPLRQAQSHSIRAIEHLVPRLASVSAEMAAVELAVRRARKRRAKEERKQQRESEQRDLGKDEVEKELEEEQGDRDGDKVPQGKGEEEKEGKENKEESVDGGGGEVDVDALEEKMARVEVASG